MTLTSISSSRASELFAYTASGLVSQHQSGRYLSGEDYDAWTADGCLISAAEGGRCMIHALGPFSDIMSAIESARPLITSCGGRAELFPRCPLPDELKDVRGEYRLAGAYRPYEDGSIRTLSPDDLPEIERMCAYDAEDSDYGHKLASEFLAGCTGNPEGALYPGRAFGIFDGGVLSGYITGDRVGGIGAKVINLFVEREKRGRGFAARLLRALAASDADALYAYSCDKGNTASLRTALSCGFVMIGESLEWERKD